MSNHLTVFPSVLYKSLLGASSIILASFIYYTYTAQTSASNKEALHERNDDDGNNPKQTTPPSLKQLVSSWQQNHDFPFLCNSIRSNALLKDLLKESCAIDNWKVLVSLGHETSLQMHETVFAQLVSKCAYHYESSKLLFPLLWDNMEVHQLLTHMKAFFKSATQYGVRVSCSKDAIQNDFDVNTETFQGKVLIIVIPGTSDFQMIVMTYTQHYTLHIEAVLTRAGVIYGNQEIQRWEDATGEPIRLDKKCICMNHMDSQTSTIDLHDDRLVVKTEYGQTIFPFSYQCTENTQTCMVFDTKKCVTV